MNKKQSRKGYYEYAPQIYPRKIWIHIGSNLKDIAQQFEEAELPGDDYYGVCFEELSRKTDNMLGILITFRSKKDMTISNICHEVCHAVDFIEQAIDMEHGGEQSAYLAGWIAGCIECAKRSNGKFINIEG